MSSQIPLWLPIHTDSPPLNLITQPSLQALWVHYRPSPPPGSAENYSLLPRNDCEDGRERCCSGQPFQRWHWCMPKSWGSLNCLIVVFIEIENAMLGERFSHFHLAHSSNVGILLGTFSQPWETCPSPGEALHLCHCIDFGCESSLPGASIRWCLAA